MKKRLIRIVSVCLSLIVFITSLNLSFLVKAEGTNPSVYINPSNTQAIYTYDGYYVVFNLNGSWTGGHNVGIQIYNTGSETIEDWTLESDYSNNISNIWNASVIENANGETKIYHDTWNSVIYPNSCVEFGFSSNETFASFPSYFGILGSEMTETNNELFSIDYTITDEWEDGYTGLVTITNNSENIIRNWALDFSCNNENISVWNAELISKEGNRVSVGNMGFNADINPSENVSFGFIVYNKTNNDEFYDYNLYESTIVSNEPQRELEPLGDIGEAYCKELRDEDVIFDEATGLQYVKNQILISAYMGTPREAIEDIVDEIGATIVGYIELTCDYQIEFSDYRSLEELQTMADYLSGYSFISLATLNLASEIDVNYYSNDYLYNDEYICLLDKYTDPISNGVIEYTKISSEKDTTGETFPSGDNWGLEALYIPSAWNHVANSTTVKVGVYDNYFEDRRDKDSELVFDDIVNNPSFNSEDYTLNHGTHVSGIIGAEHDNHTGISGVATDVQLYGYSYKCNSFYSDSMRDKIAYGKLICNQVKVINASLGFSDEGMIYAASLNDGSDDCQKAQMHIEQGAKIIEEYLLKLKNAGYDFLIVGSAGNTNNRTFERNENKKFGYKKIGIDDSQAANVDAKYGWYLGAIENEQLKKRIIIVGSVGLGSSYPFEYSKFSNVGDRVDVLAPGENILSTAPVDLDYSQIPDALKGYAVMSGTSMAAPYISGLAALMLQVNPDLNGTQIKKIICDDSNKRYSLSDCLGVAHNIPNGEKCIIQAVNTTGIPNVAFPSGEISGSVKNTSGVVITDADICAIRKDFGNYNIDLELYNYILGTDENGNYQGVLPQGTYDFIFSADTYLPAVVEDIEIKPNEIKTIPVELIKYNPKNTRGKINGVVIDAITGNVVENAIIRIRKDWNRQTGTYVADKTGSVLCASTSSAGEFELDTNIGNYTLEIEKEGYIIGYYNIISVKGSENLISTYALSPILPENEYRIILTWSEFPHDLDSHLTYYENSQQVFHVYYGNKQGFYNEVEVASLDLDDTYMYGPETITITVDTSMIGNGEFRYSVHNYSGEIGLSQSDAIIKIYNGNTQKDVIHVPVDATGNVWHVFDITSSGIIIKNEYYSAYASEVQ